MKQFTVRIISNQTKLTTVKTETSKVQNFPNFGEISKKSMKYLNQSLKKVIKPKSILRVTKDSITESKSKTSSISESNNISIENLKKSKLLFLNRVSLILTDIFTRKDIKFSIVKNLRKYELTMLLSIISKKFNKIFTINSDEISVEYLREKFLIIYQALQMEGSYKRIEENNKFIFKFTYKNLKYKFFKDNNLFDNSENELIFLRFYFQKTFQKKNINVEEFFGIKSNQIVWKSLNNKFFNLIFQSKEFSQVFFEYTKNHFQKDYEKLILKKFDKFLIKHDKILKKVSTSSMIKDFCINLNKNRKAKFPWTSTEIETALKNFEKNIQRILKKEALFIKRF